MNMYIYNYLGIYANYMLIIYQLYLIRGIIYYPWKSYYITFFGFSNVEKGRSPRAEP